MKPSDVLSQVHVTSNREIAPGVFLLSYKRIHALKAGQVVKLGLSEEGPFRMYSICSGANDPETAILFNIKDQGKLTPVLAKVSPGDELYVSGPFGSFTSRGEKAWWIATGTGVAPFYSMLRSGQGNGNRLIHGVRYLSQFYFEREFRDTLGSNYVQCCSRETAPEVFHGWVTEYIRQEENIPLDIKYYLCGSALMVVEVRDLLIERGVPFGNIMAEIYF